MDSLLRPLQKVYACDRELVPSACSIRTCPSAARELPAPVRDAMTAVAKVMTTVSYRA